MSDDAQVGTCRACGQQLILTSDDCWHPYPVERACPPESKETGMWVPEWGSFSRPGREYFVAGEGRSE